MKKPYVIEVSGAPGPCWWVAPSDEDDVTELITTADAELATKLDDFTLARAVVDQLARLFPARQFKINVMEGQG